MSTTDDEIGLLEADIKRWAGPDARIHTALEQLIKIYEAECAALAFEAYELQRQVDAEKVTSTTERERLRIAARQPETRWIDL